jgi:ATP/maltotriose-dependent transcriptional regulator MalT/DNA-binding SARP family transcriptional activator
LLRTGAADLTFDAEQSRRYLARTIPDVRDESVLQDLVRLTEGWPAGLALISSAGIRTNGSAPVLAAEGGDEAHQLLFDYLAAEVLQTLGEDERRFLLETSILEDLDAPLCAELTGCGDAAELLRSFASRGLFITRKSEAAYSSHGLFRVFLRAELTRSYPLDRIVALQLAAADAYRRRGDYVRGLEHRLAAGDREAATTELEANAFNFVASGLLSRVRRFLDDLGAACVQASPTLLAALGRLQQLRGDWDEALVSLERAMRVATEREEYAVLAEALRAMSSILASRGEFARLDALLARALALPIPDAGRTALLSTQSAVFVETERYDDAVRLFAEIMPSIVARGDLALEGMVLHNTGAAHVRRGDPYAGIAFYERALKVKASAGQRVSALVTLANQIFVTLLLGDTDEAERLVARLLEDAENLGNSTMLAYGYEYVGAIALARGDGAGSIAAYRKARGLCDPGDVLVLPEILHGYARAMLERSEVDEAEELCVKALSAMRAAGRLQPLGAVVFTRARCAFARRDAERGLALVEETLELAKAGDDALLRTMLNLDCAAALARVSAEMPASPKRARLEELADAAWASAVALMEQRDYRFLLRTKAAAFETLRQTRSIRLAEEQGAPATAVAPVAALEIEMLGGLRVSIRGEPVSPKAWMRRKARDLFAHLVSAQGRLISRTRLIDVYWPELEGDAASDLLRVTVSAIRKAVGNVIRYEEGGYRFVAPAGTTLDVAIFEQHIEAARSAEAAGSREAARNSFSRAVESYRGDFLEGAEDAAWLLRERERLRKPYLAALRWLVKNPGNDVAKRSALLDRLLDETPFDFEAVKLRLDFVTNDLGTRDAAAEYERWKVAYRATVGSEAPDIWRPMVPANR